MGNVNKLYNNIIKDFSEKEIGNEKQFETAMKSENNVKKLYDALVKKGYKESQIGNYDTFSSLILPKNPPITGEETKINQNPQDTISVDQVSLPEKNAQMPRQQLIPQADLVQQAKENIPTPTADNNYTIVGKPRQTEYPKEQPSWWESFYKGLGAGIGRVGGALIDIANIASSNRIISPNTFIDPYTGMQLGRTDVENTIVTPSYEEKLNDKIVITNPDGTKKEVYRDPGMRLAKEVDEWANEMSMEARPYYGEKDFLDLLKSGEIGKALQLGLAVTTESAIPMLVGSNPIGRIFLGTTTSADHYAMLREEMPDMPEWKRVSSSIGAGVFEQFFESKGVNPVKWFGKKGYKQGMDEAEEWAARMLMSRWKKLGLFGKNFAKDVATEGLEEVATSASNDALNSVLDLIDRDSMGNGIEQQYEDAKRANPNLTIEQFALEKARSYLNDFIGGSLAGAYMGTTARGLGEGYSRVAGREERQANEYIKRAVNEQAAATGTDAYKIAEGVYFGTPESKAVIDRANEMNIEDAITAEVDAISNNGNIISVSDGYGNEGVVVKGNVALTYTDYGKALIDRDNSDEQVYIRNNEGKIIPMAIKDAILQSQYDAEEYKQFQIAREKARYYSQETFNVGDNVYLTSNGEIIRDEAGNPLTSQVTSVGEDGSVNVEVEDVQGNVQEMTMQPEEALESLSPVAYSDGENIYIPKGNRIINNETGEIVQEFETKEEADAFIQGKTDVGEWNAFDIMSENQSENDGAPASEQNVLQENQTEEQQNVIQAEQQIPSYPLTEDGEPDFSQMTSEQSIQVLDELGDQETIDAFIANNLSDAQKSYTKAEKMKPKSTSFQAIKEEQQKIIAEREAAKAKLDLWSSIKSANDYRKLQRTSETLSDARLAEQRQARIEKEKTEKTAEFTGKTTFKESPKIYGNSYTRTLPDGTKIRGKYTIVPAESLIPSHDPNNNWETTEGFPTVDGVNVNDRDYKNDVQARQVTEQMAANYGGQAIENVPVVSSDGVVYDGNGRTIAGQIAAQNGTDAEYIQQLNENAANYGFTPEQISSVNNPRIVLVLDEDLPYNTDTFAKFNAQEKKTQSSTEKSVAAGKRMTESVVNQISDVLDSYSSIESLFGSEKATADLLKVLQDNGIIQPTEIAGLTENGLFSAAGREYITSLVLGSIFSEDAVRRMGNNLSLKNGILRAVPAILENRKLGEYSLIDGINEAITLLYEARANNMALPLYLRQTNAFDETPMDKFSEFSKLLASQLDAGVAKFRELLDIYNNSAKDHIGGQQAIFGEITKEDVKQSIIELYGKRGQNQETGSSETETVNPLQIVQGSEQTEQQSEAAEIKEDVSVDIPIVQYVMQQQNKLSEQVAENISQAESEVNTNPTEAQKKAGNYKKGHVKIDGYDITIEQPKGSTRSGVDENGNKWETKMNNTYGYIRGTQSVDGDHIDVFLSDNPTEGNVYVVDQINQETGEFDEHKVMYGFNSMEEAREAYLSNYSEGWKIGTITEVRKDEFKKWIDSSKRKTKPFSEYSSVNKTAGQNEADVQKSISTSIESTMTDSQKLAFDAISEMLDKAGIPVETLTDEQMNQLANEASLMTVYHGSGAEFDAFDHSHMGEGEGAQAYGWGSYVTEVEEIGRTYAESTSGNIFRSGFGDFYLSEIRKGLAQEKRFDDIKQSLLAHHAEMYKKAGGNTDMYGDFISDYETLQQLKESDLPQRNLYTVEIPDNTGSNYLDWEKEVDRDMSKRLSEQLFNDISGNDTEGSYEEEVEKEMLQRDIEDSFESVRTGKDLYKAISLYIGEEASSKFLSRAGFVGISYPAQYTTGGRSDNARNYVIFNEKDLEIKDRISFMRGYRSRWENSGYTEREDGTKISRNAKEAEDNGTFTEGTFRKMYGVSKKDFNLLVSLGLIKNTEWHHTGKTFKRSDYYSWADSSYSLNGESNYTLTEEGKIDYSNLENSLAQKYLDNKKEISKLSKDFDAKKWEYIQQVEKRNIPSLEEFTERKINKRTDDYLTEEEKKQRAERHNYISTVVAQSGISSFERKQMHENTDTEYRNKANERKAQEIEQIKSEYQKEYQDAYGEDIRYNGEVEKRNMEVEEHNLNANNGKEDVLMQIAGIMGMDNENSRRITEFISHTAKEDEAKQARAEEIKAFNKRVDERIENKKKEIENFIEEGKKSGEITERTRIQSEPRYFVTTKEEMSGKYGWFEASARYNLPRYYSGIEFSNKESYDKYWSMQRELYQIQSEKIYQQAEKSDGIIYGATVGGKIYMNKSALNPETPIHEYTHIWDNACRKNNPELWNRGVELMKQTPVWEEVKNDPNYSDLNTDDEIASEVHSRLTGRDGSRILEDMAEQVKREGTTSEISKTNALISKLKKWLSDFWYWVKDTMTPWTKEEASRVSLEDFINMPLKDLAQGRRLDETRFRLPDNFGETATVPINYEYGEGYYADGVSGYFVSEEALLDAFRNKYPAYVITMSEDGESLEFERFNPTNKTRGFRRYANVEYNRMRRTAENLAQELGLDVEIIEDVESLEGKKRYAKGWYDVKTKKIYIVFPNATGSRDVARTILHEGVAHYNLREMLGENFDLFLDNIYSAANKTIKSRIDGIAEKQGISRRIATEEYLAMVAEDVTPNDYNAGWFSKVKASFLKLLEKLGINLQGYLTDNDFKYIVWRSYDNLKNKAQMTTSEIAKNKQTEQRLLKQTSTEQFAAEHSSEYNNSEESRIIEESKANGTYMKAPNGRPTNLTERQWAQVRTKAFKDWFGDWENDPENASKVVDENGEPRVMYHGTREQFNVFDKNLYGRNYGGWSAINKGIHLTSKENSALLWAIKSTANGEISIMPLFVNIRNPLSETIANGYENGTLEQLGYDGYFSSEFNYPNFDAIAIEPSQVKSATDNKGDFDQNNPDIRFRIGEEAPKTRADIVTESLIKAGARKDAATSVRLHAMKAIGKSLRDINKAIREQAKYSDENVGTLRGIVNDLMRIGELSSLDSQDIRYIFSKANQAVTKSDLTEIANGIVDRLMDATNSRILSIMNKKLAEAKTKKNEKVAKASKMSGYQQITLSKLDELMKGLPTMDDAKKQYGKVKERYEDSIDENLRMELDAELEAYEMYFSYLETISPIMDNIKSLNEERDELLQAKKGKRGNEAKSYRETINEIDKAIVENKADLADALTTFVNEIDRIGKEGRENKNDFSKKKKARKELIRKLANFDLSDIPAYTQEQVNSELKKMRYWQNSGFANFLFSPLNSLNMYLKLFGRKHAGGKGYLFNYFEPKVRQAMTNRYYGVKQAKKELDDAAIRFTGMDFNKLSEELHKKSDILITYMDGGKNIERYLTHGQALYLYMINKMSDGAMKLRKMGISEEDIENIASNMDSNVLDFADWIQNDFLPKKRAKYNKVHMDMFGVPMARIENYFPIRIAKGSVDSEIDINKDTDTDMSSTITGAIIKRTANTNPIDLTTDALSALYQNIDEMEDWAAYAQIREDFNTLINYRTFRNRLKNMKSVHSSGDVLYRNFVNAVRTAVNKDTSVNSKTDRFWKNISRGTTVASLNFNLNPAIKQILGYPAIFGEADLIDIIKNTIHPYKSFKWAMENLPLFEERVSGGNAGWVQLELDKESSWEVWNKKYVEWATKIGMAPNRFMDAIVCAATAKAAYDTSLRRYKKWGFKNPEEKALADAERAYNETQPSSQGLYISPMQRSNELANIIYSLFRNANFAFYRRLVEAVRNLSRISSTNRYNKILSSTAHRLVLEEGFTEEHAEKVAREMTNRQIAKDSISLVIFGYVLNTLWSLGSNWAYLLAGDDDDEKKKMIKDALIVGLLSPITGIPLFGSFAEDWMWSILRGSYYDSTLLSTPLTDEIERTVSNSYKLAKSISKDDDRRTLFIAAEFAKSLVNLCVKTGIGINPDLLTNMVYGVINAANSDFDSVSDFRDLLFTIINAPAESREKLIIDELGITEEGLNERLSQGEIEEIFNKFVDRRIERQKGIIAPFAKEDYQTRKTAGKEFKKQVRERVELKQEDNGKD